MVSMVFASCWSVPVHIQMAKPGQGRSSWGANETGEEEERDLSSALLSWPGLILVFAAGFSQHYYFFRSFFVLHPAHPAHVWV